MNSYYVLIPLVFLAGCNPLVRQDDLTEATDRIAALERNNILLNSRIDVLTNDNAKLKSDIAFNSKWIDKSLESTDSLRKTFNSNVRLSNKEKVEEMTRRGACGTQLVQVPGGWHNQHIECTEKDLLPSPATD